MSSTDVHTAIEILHQDAHVCVVNKPAGMPVQPDPTGDRSLLEHTAALLGGAPLFLVHRLDRPVSGVVLFARNAQVAAELGRQFQGRAVGKRYWAIVEGRVEGERTLEHRLLRDGRAGRARIGDAASTEAGRPVQLSLTALGAGDRYSLVQVVPEGGAFHQIRAQLAAAGSPIKGDVKYGARRGERDRSIALHARSLAFRHPGTGQWVEFTAPTPGGLWDALYTDRPATNVEQP